MDKTLLRIIAVLLVPALGLDPSMAIGLSTIEPSLMNGRFECPNIYKTEAFELPLVAERTRRPLAQGRQSQEIQRKGAVFQYLSLTAGAGPIRTTILISQQVVVLLLASIAGWSFQATPPVPQDKPGIRVQSNGPVVTNLGYTPADSLEDAILKHRPIDLRKAVKLSFELTGNAIAKTAYLRLTPAGGQTKTVSLGLVTSERSIEKSIGELGFTSSQLAAMIIAITDANGKPLDIEHASALHARVGGPDNSPDLNNVSERPLTANKGVKVRNTLIIQGPFNEVRNMVAIRLRFSGMQRREGLQIRIVSPYGEEMGALFSRLYSDATIDYTMNADQLKQIARIEVIFHDRAEPLPLLNLNALVPNVQKVQAPSLVVPAHVHPPFGIPSDRILHVAA